MFARLQEAFAGKQDGTLSNFLNTQDTYFKSLPHVIPSATSGLPLNGAVQTLDPLGQDYQTSVVPYPNDIFMVSPSADHTSNAKRCSSSSIDQLLAIRNPAAAKGYGCGWMYTPPAKGSSSPVLSQGFYGNASGPFPNMKHPEYKKWFFNLEQAKRQILMDKCNAMKSCKDLSKDLHCQFFLEGQANPYTAVPWSSFSFGFEEYLVLARLSMQKAHRHILFLPTVTHFIRSLCLKH
jgi:hypothetical protein